MPQSETLNMIIENMESVIVGKRKAIELALITLLSDGHLLLEDVPGVGKTTLGKALAQSIQCSFARIQFTPDTLPGDVIGMSMYQMQTGEFSYIPGAVMNVPHPRPRQAFWKPWRNSRSRWTAPPMPFQGFSWSLPPRTLWSSWAPIVCRRHSWTVF